jgi:hypothetical protein
MNLTSPKTYEVLKLVLENKYVSQRMVARVSGISLGQVNKVFQWLEDNSFIEKIRKIHLKDVPENFGMVGYHLANPTGLLRAISLFRSMEKNLILESNIDLPKKEVLKYLKKQEVIFCLDTALEKYDSYFRGDTICCYVDFSKELEFIKKDLSNVKYGLARIKFYSWDFKGLDIRDGMNSQKGYTTELQTIIDLFCDDKAHYTKELLNRKWGIKL